jgi:O-phospho-L-seryl-tRNASec:L-selenocysteinyl-tRNA synthase
MLAKLAAHLAGDALSIAGLQELALPLVLPCATGMALTLVMLAAAGAPAAVRAGPAAEKSRAPAAEAAAAQALEQQQQTSSAAGPCSVNSSSSSPPVLPRFVVWSRIDQKTCLKAITAANLVPVVIELLQQGDELVTDVAGIQAAVERLGPANVAAVVTTTSCFAPR